VEKKSVGGVIIEKSANRYLSCTVKIQTWLKGCAEHTKNLTILIPRIIWKYWSEITAHVRACISLEVTKLCFFFLVIQHVTIHSETQNCFKLTANSYHNLKSNFHSNEFVSPMFCKRTILDFFFCKRTGKKQPLCWNCNFRALPNVIRRLLYSLSIML
jgi:hypothetical protein